ncbi:hypothetical protein QUF80_10015 [Desulfococcaceae bacterium HSG8]|nr:hypothetical protein [Desulfococcaceae bacterium HSG8]
MEEVVIKRKEGEFFSVICKTSSKSPFDIPGIETKATTADILDAVRESRTDRTEQVIPADG